DAYREEIENFEFDHGLIMKTPFRNKPHMVFKWADQLIRNPKILDTVEDIVTAWVALSPSDTPNSAMRVVPGTHLKDQLPHRDTFAQNNLLTRGQEVA